MRLIDADSFIADIETENINLYLNGLKGTPRPREISLTEVIDRIKEQDTVDAVEVVRCKECRWIANPFCPLYKHPTHSYDDFCSYGERKEAKT